MGNQKNRIEAAYTRFYSERNHTKVYPSEFVVRILLGDYPELNFKKPEAGESILDIGFGDGRNTVLLCDLGLDVHGIEITEEIVGQTKMRLKKLGHHPDLRNGRNNCIPYEDDSFNYILACHCCYYCDEGDTLIDNLREYHRVLKKDGVLIASIADSESYIFKNASRLSDGTWRINNCPYQNRNGYRLQAFGEKSEIEDYFSSLFTNFCLGRSRNDYFGIDEKIFWIVCNKP